MAVTPICECPNLRWGSVKKCIQCKNSIGSVTIFFFFFSTGSYQYCPPSCPFSTFYSCLYLQPAVVAPHHLFFSFCPTLFVLTFSLFFWHGLPFHLGRGFSIHAPCVLVMNPQFFISLSSSPCVLDMTDDSGPSEVCSPGL